MSGMQWHRISDGYATGEAQSQNLSDPVQELRRQGTDNRGRQLRRAAIYFRAMRGEAPVQAGGFFFGLGSGRRAVDGVALVPASFGALDAAGGVKREAHRCSKRL